MLAFALATADAASCLDPEDQALLAGYLGDFPSRKESEHFDLAWNPDDPAMDAATVDALLASLEHAWDVEVDELGWPPPDGTGPGQVLAIAFEMPAGSPGGLSAEGSCGTDYASYLIVNTTFFAHDRGYVLDLPAHEFGHLCQRATGADYHGEPESSWYAEASAVWVEDVVNPDTNLYVKDFLPRYFRAPGLGLESIQDGVDYAHCLWPMYLDQQVGGPDLVKATWTSAAPQEAALDVTGRLLDGGVAPHFADFLAHTAAFDYPDGGLFADWNHAVEVSDGVSMFAVDAEGLPVDGDGADGLEMLGAEYVRVHFDPLKPGESLRVHVHADAPWAVGAAAGGFASGVSDDAGDVDLVLGGEGTEELEFGAGPVAVAGPWTWSVELVPAPVVEPHGCGCATSSGGGGFPMALGVLCLRRRSASCRRTAGA
jgi:hypothetical protein